MSDETLDVRRRRLRFRAWHRGTKEMDLIMGKFADTHIEALTVTDLDQFEALLEEADDTVYGWIAKRTPVPDEFNNEIYKRLCRLDFMGDIPSYPHED